MRLIKIQIKQTPKEIIERIKKKASGSNFIIREVFDMKEQFKNHGVDVEKNFEYYSVMICNPDKAYKSISGSPIRGALLLPPKQIVVYPDKDTGHAIIAYVAVEKDDIKGMLSDDESFQKGLSESCNKIEELIRYVGENDEI